MTTIMPWVERQTNPSNYFHISAGIDVWRQVAEAVIVTVDGGDVATFANLQRRHPDVPIVGGVKASTFLGRNGFCIPANWKAMYAACVRIDAVTHRSCVVLECESAISDYIHGYVDWDFARLRNKWRWPKKLDVWFYPAMPVSANPDEMTRGRRLFEFLAEWMNPVPITVDMADPTWPEWPPSQEARQAVADLSGRSAIPMGYFGEWGGYTYHTYKQIPLWLDNVSQSSIAIPYPGSARWLECSQAFGDWFEPA